MQNKISIDLFVKKNYRDDLSVSNNGNMLKSNISEKKPEKSKSYKIKRNKTLKILYEEYIKDKTKSTKSESFEKDTIDETEHSSKSQINNEESKKPIKKVLSLSCNNLLKIDTIESPIEEPKRNISDDESEKMNRELNKPNKIYLEKLKKNNIDFSNNMKNIFNNIGNITRFKSDKNLDENKEESEFSLKCYIKSENIRKVYYSKLLLNRVWIPLNDSQRHNNLIIFDWDDTLLPTSFLAPRGIFEDKNELTEKEQSKINKLENSVKKLLELALSKSDVYIITNAGEGWVQFSAEKYYPSINDILKKIEVISARERFEKKYPEQSNKWKIEAFLYLKKRLNDDLITNIICVGDSVFEMEAGRILASNFIHAVIKTIKFREKPKPEELNKQLNLVLNQFNSIFSSSKNLTVRVEKKKPKDDS